MAEIETAGAELPPAATEAVAAAAAAWAAPDDA
jgi:hypothetical protein